MMGNAFFAAFLKNSLRDWSSSFSFLFFIFRKIFNIPYSFDGFSASSGDYESRRKSTQLTPNKQRIALPISGNMPNLGNHRNVSENTLKKSKSSALDIRRSWWVSMTSFRKILLMVRELTWIWEANHWFVLPWRRNSLRINCPIGTCILLSDYTSCYRFPHFPTTTKKRRAFSSPIWGRGKYLLRIDKMPAFLRASAYSSSSKNLFWNFPRFR